LAELVLLLEFLKTLLIIPGLVESFREEVVAFPVSIQPPVLPLSLDQINVAKDLEAKLGPILLWHATQNLKGPPSAIGGLNESHDTSERT